ncbi:hypothetical protein [Cryobacterium sp. GrIS_2_6]|uniref:hypothetical protein n=1 Tax=Cryobacterium sp. GrIS_2_6 TaxID=3162785 RepID=UPI002E033506|nr:hypothetical protein [Cryobacterium psychrotolerans]
MNKTSITQDSISKLMSAVTFGQSITIDPDGHTHYRDENTPQARADFEANTRERMARTEAEPVLEAYSAGLIEGQWNLSQRAVNHLIGEAHLAGVERAVLVLRTADRIEAAWAEYGIELQVDLSALSLDGSEAYNTGIPMTEAGYTAIIIVELWQLGYAGTLRGCAERRNQFATNLANGIHPIAVVEANREANEASGRNIRFAEPFSDFIG